MISIVGCECLSVCNHSRSFRHERFSSVSSVVTGNVQFIEGGVGTQREGSVFCGIPLSGVIRLHFHSDAIRDNFGQLANLFISEPIISAEISEPIHETDPTSVEAGQAARGKLVNDYPTIDGSGQHERSINGQVRSDIGRIEI